MATKHIEFMVRFFSSNPRSLMTYLTRAISINLSKSFEFWILIYSISKFTKIMVFLEWRGSVRRKNYFITYFAYYLSRLRFTVKAVTRAELLKLINY